MNCGRCMGAVAPTDAHRRRVRRSEVSRLDGLQDVAVHGGRSRLCTQERRASGAGLKGRTARRTVSPSNPGGQVILEPRAVSPRMKALARRTVAAPDLDGF